LSEKNVTDYELTACSRNGKKTEVSYNATTFYDRDRKLQGVFAAARDVTDRKRVEEKLKLYSDTLEHRKAELERLQTQMVHSEKMASLGQLAAGVAHELNNPAGFIYSNMGHLRECAAGLERLFNAYDNAQLPAPLAAEINAIKKEIYYDDSLNDLRSITSDCYEGAERIRDVVQNLRLFSRLDEAEFKKVDLHEGIESTIRLISQYYGSDRITLERDYADLPPVDCYAGQLNQVWMNLLVNAAQAISHQGKVRVTTRREREMAVISISDTGSGIGPEHLKKIFDPFFTTKPVGEGTGLGLSITYGIVERHDGSIKIESRPGEGTTITVAIPINAMRRDERAEEREQQVLLPAL
jgi:two-component system NtrC family sensor kinase